MKTAVFLYNPESGKGKIARNVGCISTIFQAYGYDVTPQRIDFTANPFDGNETIDLRGLEPAPLVGRADKHMSEYRRDNGPVDHDTAVEELKRWYAAL